MTTLMYQGSHTAYHGPCEIIDPDEVPFFHRLKGRYAIRVRNPFWNGTEWENEFETFYRVRPESILITAVVRDI